MHVPLAEIHRADPCEQVHVADPCGCCQVHATGDRPGPKRPNFAEQTPMKWASNFWASTRGSPQALQASAKARMQGLKGVCTRVIKATLPLARMAGSTGRPTGTQGLWARSRVQQGAHAVRAAGGVHVRAVADQHAHVLRVGEVVQRAAQLHAAHAIHLRARRASSSTLLKGQLCISHLPRRDSNRRTDVGRTIRAHLE